MALGNITISAEVSGLLTGQKILGPVDITSANAKAQTTVVALSSGNNVITIPSGSSAAVVRLPKTNTASILLKKTAADVGIQTSKTGTIVLNFDLDLPQVNFVLDSSAAQTALTEILFI